MATPKRSLDELASRCLLEPSLRDLIVEGVFDQWFLSRVLGDLGLSEVAVYHIDSFDMGSHLVPTDESVGNRGRVVGLAAELRRQYPQTVDGVLCVVDVDTDVLVGVDNQAQNLVNTDYSDLSMYAWAPEPLRAVLVDVLRSPLDSSDLLGMLEGPLREVGLIRAANRMTGFGLRMLSVAGDLDLSPSGAVTFNRDRYVERVLGTQGRHQDRELFEGKIEVLRSEMPSEARLCICGEDFAEALRWHARTVSPAFGRLGARELLRIVISHVDSSSVGDLALMERIREFASQ